MSNKIPRITGCKAIKVLERMGFDLVRQSGSHKIYNLELLHVHHHLDGSSSRDLAIFSMRHSTMLSIPSIW